jgi:hypothetical protein
MTALSARHLAAGVVAAVVALAAGLAVAAIPAPASARPGPVTLWAVVNVDGTLARGDGATAAQATGVDGEYRVTFDRDVSGCAYVATAGEASAFTAGPDDAITFGVAPDNQDTSTVFALEYDAILARDSYSSGFHLAVFCP